MKTPEQATIRNLIVMLKDNRQYHNAKWHNYVIRELEILEALILAKVVNWEHPHNQPAPDND